MNQEERDKILDTEPLFSSNIPISMWRRETDNKAYSVIAMPRKETCYSCYDEPFETEEEMKKYCNRAIALYENAVELFKLFKEGKIDHIYHFEKPQKYIEDMKKVCL